MNSNTLAEKETSIRSNEKIEGLERQARDLARSVESVRNQTLSQSNDRIAALEQKARDLARFVETTRQQTLLQSDKKTEALEQKARDLADFVESLRSQTRLQTETEIEALGKKARDLALSVEIVRRETRLKSEAEIAAMGQQARDLAVSVETVREETLLKSDTEIAALGQQARDLAVCVENVREETLLKSDTEIAALGQQARDLALSVESIREKTLLKSDSEIAALGKRARDLAVSVNAEREETLLHSNSEIKGLKQEASNLAVTLEKSRLETLLESDRVIRKLNEDLERRVLERTAQLEAANNELESFSYSVSHDLRAPLRAIDGFSRIVLEDHAADMPDEGKAYLRLVRENTCQMGRLVDDLLAFSRLGRQALTKSAVEPEILVRQCLIEMQSDQEGRNLELVIGEMPPCQADPMLLKQVWLNLISNALKYTRKQEAGQIEIGFRLAPPTLPDGPVDCPLVPKMERIYFVKDNGAGFDMKYAHKLFGVFQRLHRAADYEGTGVGLAIVQRIIHRHGGRIWGEGQVNHGAMFSFTLE